MNTTIQAVTLPPAKTSSNPNSCGYYILVTIAGLWIIGGSFLSQFISWSVEQTIFEGSLKVADFRWLVELGYGLYIVIPLTIAWLLVKTPSSKAVMRAWLLPGGLAILLVPARLPIITSAQLIAVLQIAGLVIYCTVLVLWAWLKPDGRPLAKNMSWYGFSLAFLLAGTLLVPWVLWGALGSVTDCFLELAVGLLAGLAISLTLRVSLLSEDQSGMRPYRPINLLRDGLVTTTMLIIFMTAISQSMNQLVLSLAVPVLGWAGIGLSRVGKRTGFQNNTIPLAVFLGLSIAWPLLWLDADELSLIVTSGTGELMGWVMQESLVMLFIGLVIGIVFLLVYRLFEHKDRFSPVLLIMVGLLWIGVGSSFFIWGKPGFYGERLFVILKDQVDVSQADKITDYNQRRSYVYQTMTAHAQKTQARITSDLNRLGIRFQSYYLVNGIEVQGGPLVRWWLAAQPEVDRILDNPILRPLPQPVPAARGNSSAPLGPQWNLTLIHADQVWKELGVNGKGIVVGQSDTGAQGDHPELAEGYRGKDGQNDYNWFDPWNGSPRPVDIVGHGTHTLGSILGKNVGVAPGASWIACVNLARNLGNPAVYLDCMQFMLAPFPQNGNPMRDGDPSRGAQVLNNSWGCPWVEGCDPNVFLPAVRALRDAGIFMVVSTGNSGYSGCGSVSDPPSIYKEVYSVGSIDRLGQLSVFSSQGPVTVDGSNRIKPDIVAPGEDILSSFPGNTYTTASGTSMAGPHVVGVVALMWSANPGLIGDIDKTTEILDRSAQRYTGNLPQCAQGSLLPNNGVGYGVVDAYAAVKMALESR